MLRKDDSELLCQHPELPDHGVQRLRTFAADLLVVSIVSGLQLILEVEKGQVLEEFLTMCERSAAGFVGFLFPLLQDLGGVRMAISLLGAPAPSSHDRV